MKILSVLAIFLLATVSAVAQESTNNNYTGSWRTNGSWADNSFPSNTAGVTGGNFNIYGYISLGGPSDPQNLTISNATSAFDFIIRDTLVVYGNVDFPSNGMDLVISSGALFVVLGDLTLGNQMDISTTGSIIVTGTFEKTGAEGQGSFTGGGNIYAGNFDIPGDWVPTADQMNTTTDLENDLPDVFDFINGGAAVGTLPVELTGFVIEYASNETIVLSWSTASQINFSHFEVEHSINAKDWSALTSIEGEGTTHELNEYSYTHTIPHNGKNYYRLRMVDLDETFEYSDVLSANASANNTVLLSPNPTKGGTVRYEMNFTPEEGDQLVVYDLLGGLVVAQSVQSFTGELVLPNTLTRGTYLVRYKEQDFSQVVRLLVD